MSELLAVNELLTICTELEAVPGLLTVTSRALVPLCMLADTLTNVADPVPDNWLRHLPSPDSTPPLLNIWASTPPGRSNIIPTAASHAADRLQRNRRPEES